MPINILMPALSPTMEKGNLAKWLKKEGDPVKAGDLLAEIETDKATMEFEATDEGTLGKILVPEGTQDVAVNTPIATILSDGEDAVAIPAETAPNVRHEVSSFTKSLLIVFDRGLQTRNLVRPGRLCIVHRFYLRGL